MKKLLSLLLVGISCALASPLALLPSAVADSNISSASYTFTTSDFSVLGNNSGTLAKKEGTKNVGNLMGTIVRIILVTLSIVCSIMIVAGGMFMAVAGGDGDRINKGKKMIIGALVGLGIALLSYTIVSLV